MWKWNSSKKINVFTGNNLCLGTKRSRWVNWRSVSVLGYIYFSLSNGQTYRGGGLGLVGVLSAWTMARGKYEAIGLKKIRRQGNSSIFWIFSLPGATFGCFNPQLLLFPDLSAICFHDDTRTVEVPWSEISSLVEIEAFVRGGWGQIKSLGGRLFRNEQSL